LLLLHKYSSNITRFFSFRVFLQWFTFQFYVCRSLSFTLAANGISAGNVFATLDLRDGRSPSVSMLAKMGLALG